MIWFYVPSEKSFTLTSIIFYVFFAIFQIIYYFFAHSMAIFGQFCILFSYSIHLNDRKHQQIFTFLWRYNFWIFSYFYSIFFSLSKQTAKVVKHFMKRKFVMFALLRNHFWRSIPPTNRSVAMCSFIFNFYFVFGMKSSYLFVG